jgi:hypothetical protein
MTRCCQDAWLSGTLITLQPVVKSFDATVLREGLRWVRFLYSILRWSNYPESFGLLDLDNGQDNWMNTTAVIGKVALGILL